VGQFVVIVLSAIPDDDLFHDHDYCASTEPAALELSLNQNEELHQEISRLQMQIEEITINSKVLLGAVFCL